MLQTLLPVDAQLSGRFKGSISQQAAGHSSIKWLHEVGTEVGSGDGSADGTADGAGDGSIVGSGDGIIVGEQTGGLPSGESLNIGLSGRHSNGQH